MTKIITLLALATMLAVIPAHAGVKVIGTLPNGDKIVRIKTFGLFAPATTTVIVVGKASGDIATLNSAGGPGVLPAVANAGGLVGAATMLRPARSHTNVEQSGGGASASSSNVNQNVNNNSNSNFNQNTVTGGGNQNGSIHHNN
jgi:hypothetical protein